MLVSIAFKEFHQPQGLSFILLLKIRSVSRQTKVNSFIGFNVMTVSVRIREVKATGQTTGLSHE